VWTADNRLFSAGHHALITEWDTLRLQRKTSSDSYGGAVWCIAVDATGTTLAAGCEDGSVRLFDLSDGSLRYIRSFEGQRGRILSVAWSSTGTMLVSGSAEGTIRVWNVPTGTFFFWVSFFCVLMWSSFYNSTNSQANDRAFAGSQAACAHLVPFGSSVRVLATAIIAEFFLFCVYFRDDTVVSGDSQGNVNFWDGNSGTVLQSIMSHSADVLSIAVAKDGKSIYAAGVDNKVVHMRSMETVGKWVISGSKRSHTHDVRALALSPIAAHKLLISGGVDTNIIAYSTADLSKSSSRIISPFPHKPIVAFARSKRVLCCMYPHHLELWVIGKSAPIEEPLTSRPNHSVLPLADPHGKLAELRIKVQ